MGLSCGQSAAIGADSLCDNADEASDGMLALSLAFLGGHTASLIDCPKMTLSSYDCAVSMSLRPARLTRVPSSWLG
jgi:hypothetical protein